MPRRRSSPAPVGYLAPPPPRVFAHRGLATEAPENTLLAFVKALATGVEYLETDVHASADSVAILSHDPDLKRMTGRDIRIGQLTRVELSRIDLGAGQGFATLAEALDAFPDARFNIDIKDAAAAAPAAAAILAAGATDRVMIGSFSNRRRLAAVRLLPGVATSVSSLGVVVAIIGAKLGIHPLVRRALREASAMQIPLSVLRMRTTTPRVLAAVHDAGVELHIWTINDPAIMDRLLTAGIDGVMTDRVDLAMPVLRRHRAGV